MQDPSAEAIIDLSEKERAEKKNIAVFEFLGTLLLVYGAMASGSQNFGIAMVYFICLVFFGRMSGGHFNPIITLISYIDGTTQKHLIPFYIGAQFAASFAAAIILMPILDLTQAPYFEEYPGRQVFGTMMAEICGSTLFFVFVQIQTNIQTRVTQGTIASAVFLSVIFFVAREYTITMDNSLFNPAAAIALELFYGIYYGKWAQMTNLLSYILGPWLGSLLAITFYWQVYVPTLKKK